MEKMLDELKESVSLLPFPNKGAIGGHIESHGRIIEIFHNFVSLFGSFCKGTNAEIKELNNRVMYLGDKLLECKKDLNIKRDKIFDLSNKLDLYMEAHKKPIKIIKTAILSGLATVSGITIHQSIIPFTYKIHKMVFNNSKNHYFQESKVDGKNVLRLFFGKESKVGAIEYTIFISTSK